AWPALGLAGALAMAASGGPLMAASAGPATAWWFGLSTGHAGNLAVFYLGMAGFSVAWLGLGLQLRGDASRRPSPRRLLVVAALWTIPLLAGPVLFTRDVYSYAAQGTITHLGLNPYTYGPNVLQAFGHSPLVRAVAPVWRATPAPYGPVFLAVAGLVMGGAGGHLVAAVAGFKLLDLVGVGLIAWSVPRLARHLGADPALALWLGLLSPLVLLDFVAAGHNDALMVGLVVAGVTLAVEDHPVTGILLCSLAATVKVPALAGVAFIAVAWARRQPDPRDRAAVLAKAGAVAVGALVVITLATGLGWGWLSAGTLSTEGNVVTGITPTSAVGTAVATLLRLAGIGVGNAGAVAAFRVAGLVVGGVVGAVLVLRTRRDTMVISLAVAFLVVVVAGPVLWPWYLTWSVVLLAAHPAGQRSRVLVVVLAGYSFVVGPTGANLVSQSWSLPVAVAMVVAAVWAWRAGRPVEWPWRGPSGRPSGWLAKEPARGLQYGPGRLRGGPGRLRGGSDGGRSGPSAHTGLAGPSHDPHTVRQR
ncbi:MAG: polyprenol phosphomannose-dependent alpha 1,6 mannosyltransferase MptB, partial [Acidimicrobiales bacterium]